MSADARMPVSIIVERRKSQHPWQDHVWRPIGVLPRANPERWTLLVEGEGWAHFLACTLPLELHRGETEGYLVNLSQVPPVVYVVLRRGETTDEMEIEPFHATVCPYEAMSYGESGEEIVEGVPMPTEVHDWVKKFVATHHVEAPFVKRKKSGRATPDAQPPRSPRPEEFS
jgi:Protein of unknown function (DUF3305)